MVETTPTPLRLLMVEDSDLDAAMLLHELGQGGYKVTSQRVDTLQAMQVALEEGQWDIITSDHSMPTFSAPAALKLAKKLSPEVPFIIVSGEIDLNLAVSLLKAGAHDYIQKHELIRLIPSIQRELEEVKLRIKQRQTEEARRVSEEKFYKAFQNSPDCINLNRISDGMYLAVNAGFERLSGYSSEDALGVSNAVLSLSAFNEDRIRLTKKLLQNGELNDEEIYYRRRNGQIFPVLCSARLITISGEQCALWFARDLSEQRRAEAEIRRRSRELQAVSQIITAVTIQMKLPQVLKEALNGVIALTEMEAGAVYLCAAEGQELVLAASSQLNPEDDAWLPAQNIQPAEAIYRELIISPEPLTWNGGRSMDVHPLTPDGGLQVFFPIRAKDQLVGALYLLTSESGEIIPESTFKLTQHLCGAIAMAVENARFYETIQEHASQLEKRVAERTEQLSVINSELETFNYSIAHDLRAPLRGISSGTEMLLEDQANQLPQESRQILEHIAAASHKMDQLIVALLDFSRLSRKPLNKTDLNIQEIVNETIRSLAPEIANRPIEWVLGDLPPASADLVLIRQVFANLLGNAVKYTRTREKARIELGSSVEDGLVTYFVRDNGVGFDMEYADKLFNLFQRLHADSQFEGNGVGLANVKRIILRHGGRIWAEAEVDKGAAFYFTL